MWDKNAAVKHLNARAHACSLGRCAEFVREAVEAGGVRLRLPVTVYRYGSAA